MSKGQEFDIEVTDENNRGGDREIYKLKSLSEESFPEGGRWLR